MNIHEYQAKELFGAAGIPVQDQILATTPAEARDAAQKLGLPVVIKAQVLAGGRGKAGGVKLAHSEEEAEARAKDILALTIKSYPVEKVLVTRAVDIEQEFYVGLTLDRTTKKLVLMMSAEGGVDIEELAVERPDAIVRVPVDPKAGLSDSELLPELKKVFGSYELVDQAKDAVHKLLALYQEKDFSLVEINPYARIGDNRMIALDAKVNFDDNALFKHTDAEAMRNPEEDSDDEKAAKAAGLSFVSMEGDIGCIVNGAGLAMATMDIIKLYGGNPANFLDVGGSSNPQKMVSALKIILGNPKVKAILINIFGGITRGDDIANGILQASREIDLSVPMVIRLIGTNDEEGRQILQGAGFEAETDLSTAVQKVVEVAYGGKG